MTSAPNNMLEKQTLEKKYLNSRVNLLFVVALTTVNLFLLVAQSDTYFLFSAYIPYLLVILGMHYSGMLPDEFYGAELVKPEATEQSVFYICVAIAVIVLVLYLASWLLSKKSAGWLIFALAFFVADTLLFIVLEGIGLNSIIDLIFHGYVIYSLSMGVYANSKLKKLPLQEVMLMESDTTANTPADPNNDFMNLK